jgi:hypothetical protein
MDDGHRHLTQVSQSHVINPPSSQLLLLLYIFLLRHCLGHCRQPCCLLHFHSHPITQRCREILFELAETFSLSISAQVIIDFVKFDEKNGKILQ